MWSQSGEGGNYRGGEAKGHYLLDNAKSYLEVSVDDAILVTEFNSCQYLLRERLHQRRVHKPLVSNLQIKGCTTNITGQSVYGHRQSN